MGASATQSFQRHFQRVGREPLHGGARTEGTSDSRAGCSQQLIRSRQPGDGTALQTGWGQDRAPRRARGLADRGREIWGLHTRTRARARCQTSSHVQAQWRVAPGGNPRTRAPPPALRESHAPEEDKGGSLWPGWGDRVLVFPHTAFVLISLLFRCSRCSDTGPRSPHPLAPDFSGHPFSPLPKASVCAQSL